MGLFVTIPFDYDDLPSEERRRIVPICVSSLTGGNTPFRGRGLNKASRLSMDTSLISPPPAVGRRRDAGRGARASEVGTAGEIGRERADVPAHEHRPALGPQLQPGLETRPTAHCCALVMNRRPSQRPSAAARQPRSSVAALSSSNAASSRTSAPRTSA